MPIDLSPFKGRLPYASELYGVYQPLLGWKARRAVFRFSDGLTSFNDRLVDTAISRIQPNVSITFDNDPRQFQVTRFEVGDVAPPTRDNTPEVINSFVARLILPRIASIGPDNPDAWGAILSPGALKAALTEVQPDVEKFYRDSYSALQGRNPTAAATVDYRSVIRGMLDRESKVAGGLSYLYANQHFDVLRRLFFVADQDVSLQDAVGALRLIDPLEDFDPRTELDRVSLSPLGIVYLSRQYFFEFATFLGPPVQHLWLSPDKLRRRELEKG